MERAAADAAAAERAAAEKAAAERAAAEKAAAKKAEEAEAAAAKAVKAAERAAAEKAAAGKAAAEKVAAEKAAAEKAKAQLKARMCSAWRDLLNGFAAYKRDSGVIGFYSWCWCVNPTMARPSLRTVVTSACELVVKHQLTHTDLAQTFGGGWVCIRDEIGRCHRTAASKTGRVVPDTLSADDIGWAAIIEHIDSCYPQMSPGPRDQQGASSTT